MRKIFIILFIVVAGAPVQAQELVAIGGLSIHSLSDLKSFQRSMNNELVVPMKSTQSFPNYLQFGGILRFRAGNENLKMGVIGYTTSTTARSDYSDYSGTQRIDYRLRCVGVSYYISYCLQRYKHSSISLYGHLGILYNTLEIDLSITVYDQSTVEHYEFNSVNEVAEMGLEYKHSLGGNFFVTGQGGFHANIANEMQTDEGDSIPAADWTGVKLMVGIGFSFYKD